ncbi:hypothetical protein E2C01_069256 [Portunus trituberculatus]|uniref:Uncharacterized protein n=1 Tax=Portunus trituberculatus TaxID=210409 RepID=A0A5B7I1P7_PORTR|nr:hypothetical protein [Portunus trituberculatus]
MLASDAAKSRTSASEWECLPLLPQATVESCFLGRHQVTSKTLQIDCGFLVVHFSPSAKTNWRVLPLC